MKKFAVIGHPVKNSLSPAIHQVFAKELGVEISYEKIDPGPDGFKDAVKAFRAAGGMGLSVTLPFKAQAHHLADKRMPTAQAGLAANTLWWDRRGDLNADNTDGPGLVWDLQQRLSIDLKGARVLLVGAGGAAASVLPSLLVEQPQKIWVANRTVERALSLLSQQSTEHQSILEAIPLGGVMQEPVDLILNASSQGHKGIAPALSETAVGADTFCYDLSYSAAAKPFLDWAATHKVKCHADGIGMLVAQAALQCERWLGKRPNVQATLEKINAIIAMGS